MKTQLGARRDTTRRAPRRSPRRAIATPRFHPRVLERRREAQADARAPVQRAAALEPREAHDRGEEAQRLPADLLRDQLALDGGHIRPREGRVRRVRRSQSARHAELPEVRRQREPVAHVEEEGDVLAAAREERVLRVVARPVVALVRGILGLFGIGKKK